MFEQAVETAKFVKEVKVGGDTNFPYMKLENGILTIDSITWMVGSTLLPMGTSLGITRFVIPAIIGSFTGVTQLGIVIFILINLAQTKFGKPIEAVDGKMPKGADAGLVEYVNKGLWSMAVNYTIERGIGDFVRSHVSFLKRTPKPVAVVEE
jgi:hypothetical protein